MPAFGVIRNPPQAVPPYDESRTSKYILYNLFITNKGAVRQISALLLDKAKLQQGYNTTFQAMLKVKY